MPSNWSQLRVFLKIFIDLCSRRRDRLDPALEQALCSIIAELDNGKTPALDTLLEFESLFAKLVSPDPHLKYLHCVLKGFRERTYRPIALRPGSSSIRESAS